MTAMNDEIAQLQEQITELKSKLAEARRRTGGEVVQDYTLKNSDGSEVKLSQLFGDKPDLLVVHNMGKGCRYCTLWADGFVGFTPHLENRGAFVVMSNDPPDVQREFAKSRGWNFRMASSRGTSFFKDMGYEPEPGKYWPGASAFHKDASGKITRTGHATFGPGDDFCAIWHLFELFKDGVNKWQPQYTYVRE